MRYDELSPQRLIDQLRTWFHARDRSLVLDDSCFLELPEISSPGAPPVDRHRVYAQQAASGPGFGLYHQDEDGRERQFSGDVAAWQAAVSSVLALPALRAFWPMSALDYTNPQVKDLAGGGYHLTNNNTATFGYDPTQTLVPCCFLDGTNQYLSRADGGAANWADITGTEAYVENTAVGARGLTWGCWVRPEETGTVESVFTKWSNAAGNFSYRLILLATDTFRAQISDDGTNFDLADSAAVSMEAWYLVAGRFDPAASVDVFVNGVWVTQATARASVFDGTTEVNIGAQAGGTNPLQGRMALAFLCAAYVADAAMDALFQQTRAMFGV